VQHPTVGHEQDRRVDKQRLDRGSAPEQTEGGLENEPREQADGAKSRLDMLASERLLNRRSSSRRAR
jgi:hypothetical protein